MKNSASCIWQDLLKERDRMKDIVFLEPNKIDSEPFTTSKIIAEMTGIEHRKLSVYQIQNQRDSVAVL